MNSSPVELLVSVGSFYLPDALQNSGHVGQRNAIPIHPLFHYFHDCMVVSVCMLWIHNLIRRYTVVSVYTILTHNLPPHCLLSFLDSVTYFCHPSCPEVE